MGDERIYTPAMEGIRARAGIERRPSTQNLLDIAKRIEQFITDNGWNWCDMNQVYKILKACNE